MPANFYLRYGKRTFDFVSGLLGVILLAPLFLMIPLLIIICDGGPVFFRQRRVGKGFEPFMLLKFRTMINDAPQKGISVTAGGDPRITAVGRALRKTKLDELPQLWNVLKGEMSIVGPRPEVPGYVESFKEDYEEILKIRPGITDYAAIEFRNEEETLGRYESPEEGYLNDVLPEKIRLYKKYIRDIGPGNDLRLIWLTLLRLAGNSKSVHRESRKVCHSRTDA
ncbi:MAG: sugar transferase [Nitrospirae bacterium]|nr:sugar transferase [Nitrospirota bacterium]